MMRIRQFFLAILVLSQFTSIALAQQSNNGASSDSTSNIEQQAQSNQHVATAYFFVSGMGGSPGNVKVELNGKLIGALQPHSGLAVALIPNTDNELIFRSIYSGINTLTLHAEQAGTHSYYKIFVEPFNVKALRVEQTNEETGEQLEHQYTFVKPSVSFDSPSVYPEAVKALYKACQKQEVNGVTCCEIPSCNQYQLKTPKELQTPEFKSHHHT